MSKHASTQESIQAELEVFERYSRRENEDWLYWGYRGPIFACAGFVPKTWTEIEGVWRPFGPFTDYPGGGLSRGFGGQRPKPADVFAGRAFFLCGFVQGQRQPVL